MPAKKKPMVIDPMSMVQPCPRLQARIDAFHADIARLKAEQRHAEAMCAAACGSWVGAAEAVSKMAREYAETAKDDGIGARTADALAVKARLCVEEAKAKNAAADFEKAVADRVEAARQEWAYLAETERKSAEVSRSMLSDARGAQRDAENAREIAQLAAARDRESKHYWGFCGLVLGAVIAAMLGAFLP